METEKCFVKQANRRQVRRKRQVHVAEEGFIEQVKQSSQFQFF